MLKLKHVTLKNFFSVGQVTQTVTFDEGVMTLILGNNPDYGEGIRNGVGKAQPLYSKIRTPSGWKTMKDIGVGDFVCTPSGGTTVVLGKYPQGKKKVYDITTADGKTTRACREHLWSVTVDGEQQVIDTQTISQLMRKNVKVQLPLVTEIGNQDADLPLPPYVLGLFLARGKVDNGQLLFNDVSPEVLDKLKVYLIPSDYVLKYDQNNIRCTYIHEGLRNPIVNYLVDADIDTNKRVPDAFKVGSYYQRRDLLMGLFDVDAEQDEDRVVTYFNYKQPELAGDIQELAWSVGGMSTLKMVTYTIRDKVKGVRNSDKDIILKCQFKNANKFFSIESKRDYPLLNNLMMPLRSIKFAEETEACCIKVNDQEHLYVTDDYIPTHNTTVINGISYALYGQPITTSKQDEMVNNINNKNMMVTLDFNADGVDYRIERGRKPKVMKFIKFDGEKEISLLDEEDSQDRAQGANNSTQADINSVTNISYLLFKYIIAMNTYSTHFMAAGASEQRTVIEEILGVDVMSRKAEVLTQRIKDTKIEIDKEGIRIEAIQNANRRVEDNIARLRSRSGLWESEKKDTINQLVSRLSQLGDLDIDVEITKHEKNAETSEILNEVKLVNSELNSLKQFRNKAITEMQRTDRDLQSFQKNVCPSCKQEINNDSHEAHKQKLTESLTKMFTEVDEQEKKIVEYDAVLSQIGELPEIEVTFYNNINDAYEHKTTMQNLLDKIDAKQADNNPYTDQIDDLENGESGIQEIDYGKIKEYERKLAHEKFLQKLLTNRDSFIRKRIIDYSLPFLNKMFQHYIDKMSLPHKVVFDPNLTFSISDKGRNISFNNLSRGEQNRVTFCLNLAFRDLYENLVGPVNCLFVDEILDFGMDTVGAKDGVAILKDVALTRKKAVYLVTHKDELMEHVDKTILVSKENGFTTYEHIDS